jgi:hypothetical protein
MGRGREFFSISFLFFPAIRWDGAAAAFEDPHFLVDGDLATVAGTSDTDAGGW